MAVLVTGVAGFIGFHVANRLLKKGFKVIGIDNLNPYYDVNLKKNRLSQLTINNDFDFYDADLFDYQSIIDFVKSHPYINKIVHLAAQAGVRYSLINPLSYAQSNMVGTLSILELAKRLPQCDHVVYASSSSVYGSNTKLPFAVKDPTDTPISLYAATKKSCELMGYAYSHLFQIPITGLRFFTVYGPWGRPDMSAFIFTKAILQEQEFPVFNNGMMRRNFTFINDIVDGTVSCLLNPPTTPEHRVFNIGNNKSEALLDFITVLEEVIGKKAKMRFEPLQAGDVVETIADISDTTHTFGFVPKVNIQDGLTEFVSWYRAYFNV